MMTRKITMEHIQRKGSTPKLTVRKDKNRFLPLTKFFRNRSLMLMFAQYALYTTNPLLPYFVSGNLS